MLEIVHFLHILSGAVWAGGSLLFAFVIEPALLSLDNSVDKTARAAITRFVPRLMAPIGILLLLTGLGRVALSGAVSSLADLGSGYVLLSALALLLVLVVTISGARYRARVDAVVDQGGERAQLGRLWRRQALVTGVGILAIIAIMTILGLGLY